MTSLTPKLLNLRRILLKDCGYDTDAEEQSLYDSQRFLEESGISQNGTGQPQPLRSWEVERLMELSGLVKSQLSMWVLDTFGGMAVREKP